MSLSGVYFSTLVSGIHREATAAGARVIAVQTLDSGTTAVDIPIAPDHRHEIAWNQVDGFVVILNAVDHDYLAALRASGKQVVLISEDAPSPGCPRVLPDNRSGARQAVRHLLEHGHQRIAFAGNLRQKDIRERYEAYRDELTASGIACDPELLYDTGDNQRAGGERAARAMLAAGLPSTAVLTGNDLNAVGLMQALAAAGHRVPEAQAVVGFDDIAAAAFQDPRLSTVRQHIEEVGATAAGLLIRMITSGETPATHHYLPTTLVTRESCGCSAALTDEVPDRDTVTSRELLGTALREMVIVDGPGADVSGLPRIADTLADAIEAAERGSPLPDLTELRDWLTRVYRVRNRPEYLHEITRCVRAYGRHVLARRDGNGSGDDLRAELVATRNVETCVQEILLTVAQAQANARHHDNERFETAFGQLYRVSLDLLRSHEEDPRTLAWLEDTEAEAGCLGLWWGEDVGRSLDLVGHFDRVARNEPRSQWRVAVQDFPPQDLVSIADETPGGMVVVTPLRQSGVDRGLLAAVTSTGNWVASSRDTFSQWAALLTGALNHQSVLASLREREERLRYAALYDELTGLPNRALLLDRLRQAIHRAERHQERRFAVLLLDLDGFKVVNDSLGHAAGDELLKEVAGRITSDLRATDTAARFGGDEFALLVEELAGAEDHLTVANRLHRVLEEPYIVNGHEVVVKATIGITVGADGDRLAEDVLRDADTAMYWAKSMDRGSNAVFDRSMHTRVVGRLHVEADLRRALDSGELEVHHQPIVHLATDEPAGFEALVRWQHPERGLVPPADFLPVAEETGLIRRIDTWVLNQACQELRAWQVAGVVDPETQICVNVSNRQFWHGNLTETVSTCLATTGLDPSCLVLEITEGVIMDDADLACAMLAEIHALGIRVHMDDFGTGYSSLEALHRLPIDALKIDRSFVWRMGDDPKSEELVRTIVMMGTNLGLDLIAEGIESASQQEYLLDLGCRYGQGFWFSKPVPAVQAEEYLRLRRELRVTA